jgi:WD40 repeat protein/uncharacterized caspase-like protein
MRLILLFISLTVLNAGLSAQRPELILPSANSNQLFKVAISPNEKYYATADLDDQVKIWEASSGLLIKTIQEKNMVGELVFAPDNNTLMITAGKGLQVYNINTGNTQYLIPHIEPLGLAVSTDGKWVAAACNYEYNELPIIYLWKFELGFQLTDSIAGSLGNNELKFTPDSKLLVSYGGEDVQLFSVQKLAPYKMLKGHTEKVVDINFSKTGKEAVTSSYDKTAILWDAATGKQLLVFKGHNKAVWMAQFHPNGKNIISGASDNNVIIWDKKTGKAIKTITKHKDWVYQVKISPDNRTFAASDGKGYCSVWDAKNDSMLFMFRSGGQTLYFLNYLNNGKQILAGNYDPVLSKWDIATRKKQLSYGNHNERFTNIALSNDEKTILTTSRDGNVRSIDIETGHINFTFPAFADGNWATSVNFSKDDDVIAVSGGGNSSLLINRDGKKQTTLNDFTTTYESFNNFSPDGKYILHTSNYNLQVIQVDENKAIINEDSLSAFTNHNFSPDSKYIIAGAKKKIKVWSLEKEVLVTESVIDSEYPDFIEINNNSSFYMYCDKNIGEAIVWQMGTGKKTNRFTNTSFAAFTTDPAILFVLFNNGIAKLISLKDESVLQTWQMEETVKYAKYYQYIASKDWLIAKGGDRVRIFSLVTGKILKELTGNEYAIGTSLKYIFLLKNDVTEVYDTKNWDLLYSHYSIRDNDYLVQDAKGRYDGTDAARKEIYFVCGKEIIEMNQVKDLLWVPNLTQRIMKKEAINTPGIDALGICSLTPVVEETTGKQDEYNFNITPRKGGLGETVFYINGIEAKRYKIQQLTKAGNNYKLTIKKADVKRYFTSGSENLVSLKSFTANNTITSRSIIVTEESLTTDNTPPNLYAVIVGVSDYKGEQLDLKYAGKDASDISAAISLSARKLLNADKKEHVFVYNFTTEKDRYQLPEKNAIKKVLEEIGKKALPNDILLLFFAGHGVMAGPETQKQFYFLTADASPELASSNAAAAGISTAELTEWMKPENIKAQKRILIFDACNSGQAIKDFVKLGGGDKGYFAARNDENAQLIKAIDKLNEKSGLFILSASASNQSAYEMGRFSQGLLTYSLLRAIKMQPDILEDGKFLNISRWFNAAEKSVTELSRESGARQEPQVVSNTNFNVGIVDNEVMAKIILPQEKPLFTASNFQNNDEAIADDDLDFSNTLNLKLGDMSARNAESKIIYATASTSPDAYSLTGRYTVKDNAITVSVNIKQNKIVKSKFTITGTKDKITEMAAEIINKATLFVLNL